MQNFRKALQFNCAVLSAVWSVPDAPCARALPADDADRRRSSSWGSGFALAEQGECGGGNTKSGRKPQLGGCELQTGAVLFDSIITQIRAISNQKIRRFSDFFGKLGQLDRTVIAQTAYLAVLYGEKCVVNLTRTRIHHAAQVAAECAGAPWPLPRVWRHRGTACPRRAPDP